VFAASLCAVFVVHSNEGAFSCVLLQAIIICISYYAYQKIVYLYYLKLLRIFMLLFD